LVRLRQETISGFENKPGSTKLATLFKLLSALDLELHVIPKVEVTATQGWSGELGVPQEWDQPQASKSSFQGNHLRYPIKILKTT
jgi:hypothetical protein